jgi:MurNAc alpha-1-phosphate uridylyltransferase
MTAAKGKRTERDKGPEKAMVFAAGLGERMRPITERLPKPLVEIQGRSLLDRILDRLEAGGVRVTVINLFHLGALIEEHLAGRKSPKIVFSREEERLETGGGLLKALPLLGDKPFFVVNGDVLWLDGRRPALARLAEAFDPERMDALLLLHPTVFAVGYDGPGDFMMDDMGILRRRGEGLIAPFVFAGLQIISPRLLAGAQSGVFSLNSLYDRAIESERLWGLRHDGEWFHVGTPADLELAEDLLQETIGYTVHR